MSMFQTMFIAILEYFVVNKGIARDYYYFLSIENGHL
jgi:hypothetical protein